MAWLLALACIAFYSMFFLGSAAISNLEAISLLDSPAALCFESLLSCVVLLATIAFCVSREQLSIRSSLALRFQAKTWVYILLGFVFALSASVLIDACLFYIEKVLELFLQGTNFAGNLNLASIIANIDETNKINSVLLFILVIFVAPLLEELFFRGLLLRAFSSKYSPLWAVFASSLFYALSRFDLMMGVSSLFLGLIYCWLRLTSHSIYPAVAAHIAVSAFSFLLSALGYSYGVGGDNYPWLWLVVATLFCFTSFIGLRFLPRTK